MHGQDRQMPPCNYLIKINLLLEPGLEPGLPWNPNTGKITNTEKYKRKVKVPFLVQLFRANSQKVLKI